MRPCWRYPDRRRVRAGAFAGGFASGDRSHARATRTLGRASRRERSTAPARDASRTSGRTAFGDPYLRTERTGAVAIWRPSLRLAKMLPRAVPRPARTTCRVARAGST
jgi:hypothetical protein